MPHDVDHVAPAEGRQTRSNVAVHFASDVTHPLAPGRPAPRPRPCHDDLEHRSSLRPAGSSPGSEKPCTGRVPSFSIDPDRGEVHRKGSASPCSIGSLAAPAPAPPPRRFPSRSYSARPSRRTAARPRSDRARRLQHVGQVEHRIAVVSEQVSFRMSTTACRARVSTLFEAGLRLRRSAQPGTPRHTTWVTMSSTRGGVCAGSPSHSAAGLGDLALLVHRLREHRARRREHCRRSPIRSRNDTVCPAAAPRRRAGRPDEHLDERLVVRHARADVPDFVRIVAVGLVAAGAPCAFELAVSSRGETTSRLCIVATRRARR